MQVPLIGQPVCRSVPDSPPVRPGRRPRLRPSLDAPRSGSDGFSLVEVLVAMGLLMTAVVSLAQLFVLATRANAAAGEMTEATVLAAQKIEELRTAPHTGVQTSQTVEYLDSRGERLGAAAGRRAYVRRWWIESLSAGSAAGTDVVTVAVSRYQLGGRGMSNAGGPAADAPVESYVEGSGEGTGEDTQENTVPQEIVRLVTLRTRRAP